MTPCSWPRFLVQVLAQGGGAETLFSPGPRALRLVHTSWGGVAGTPAFSRLPRTTVGCPSDRHRGARPHRRTSMMPAGRNHGAAVMSLWIWRDSTWTFNVVFPENFSLKRVSGRNVGKSGVQNSTQSSVSVVFCLLGVHGLRTRVFLFLTSSDILKFSSSFILFKFN